MNTRRQFLIRAPLGCPRRGRGVRQRAAADLRAAGTVAQATPTTPGAPPTFGTGAGSGPAVTPDDVRRSRKADAGDDDAGRAAAGRRHVAAVAGAVPRAAHRAAQGRDRRRPTRRRRSGIRCCRASPPGRTRDRFVRSKTDGAPLPSSDDAIAFAPVTQLSRWIESRKLTSERLTNIYLESHRAARRRRSAAVITLTKDHALARAKAADAEIAAGKYRGPLHGIPYGVKDLLDTKDIPTTYGAEPFRNRVPSADSAVVRRLNDAGAVLIAKLSLGALALNDIWFGGQTMNPWLLEEGASGSSAGPGAATAAALVAFSIGSETGGSIVAPAMRCGVTGLRPTFGRVPRTRRDDAVLVARQARPDDAIGRRRDARAPGDHRPGRRRPVERAEPSRLRRHGAGRRPQSRLHRAVDEGEPRDRRRSRGDGDDEEARDGAEGSHAARLAVQLADADSVCGRRGVVRGAGAQQSARRAQGAGQGRVAESVPPGAIPLGGGLRAGRSAAAQGRAGDGAHLHARSTC